MPINRKITTAVPMRRLRPPPGGLPSQTFAIATPSLLRVTGELAAVVNRFKDRPGLFRTANQREFDAGRLTTGILVLDLCLAGGLKKSRGSMVYGEKSTGKSTLTYLAIASAQRDNRDSKAVIIDIEGTFDPEWAARFGVDLERLLVVEPESGEEAVDIADAVLRSAEVSIIVTDSIAMLVPMAEIKASAGDSLPGVHARLVGNYLRRLTSGLLVERHRGHNPVVLYINQYRMRIGVMFGDPRTLPGGKALEFATSQQIVTFNKEVQNEPKSKDQSNTEAAMVMHNEHEIHITKDKTGGRLKVGKFKLIRNEELTGLPVGYIEQPRTLVTWGTPAGVVTGRYQLAEFGNFRSFDDINKFFVEQPEVQRELHGRVIAYYREKWGVS